MTLIANHINSTIRPGLDYKSPYELVDTEEMKKLLEVFNMSQVAADERDRFKFCVNVKN